MIVLLVCRDSCSVLCMDSTVVDKKVRLVVEVDGVLKDALDRQAEVEDRTVAAVVRRLLREGLPKSAYATSRGGAVDRIGPPSTGIAGRPIGGQDAAAGAGVEARRDEHLVETSLVAPADVDSPVRIVSKVGPRRAESVPNCGKGKHPVTRKMGSFCGLCGDQKAWSE